MKNKIFLCFLLVCLIVLNVNLVTSQESICDLDASIVNQDPFPAIPGELVKVVFQVDGTADPRCGTVTFQLIENFPFSLEPGTGPTQHIQASTYTSSDFPSFWLVPYNIVIDDAALDGENPIKVRYEGRGVGAKIEEFNITVENILADFEVSIKEAWKYKNKRRTHS